MKKYLFSFILTVFLFITGVGQTPCVNRFESKINNGGGNCDPLNGQIATGSFTLTFNGAIEASNIPVVTAIYDVTDALNPQLVTNIAYGTGTLLANGDVTYCYYVGPNNNNNLQGSGSDYLFVILYNDGQTCVEGSALPVSLYSFTAVRDRSSVVLKWATASEVDNLGFEIQRLVGNSKWESVGFLATHAVNGNSNSSLSYEYIDKNAVQVVSYYRIRQIDIDYKSKLSTVKIVRGETQNSKTLIYPNPSTGTINIVLENTNNPHNIFLMDMSGRMLKQWTSIVTSIQVDNLKAGIYTMKIVNSITGKEMAKKVVVK